MSTGAGRGCRTTLGFGTTGVADVATFCFTVSATTKPPAAIALGGIAVGEIPAFEVSSLNADVTIAAGIDGARAPNSFFFGSFERKTVFVLIATDSASRFRTSVLTFATRGGALGVATSTTRFVDEDLAAEAFTLADFDFDSGALLLSADDGTAEFFLDLPDFIGGPRDLRLQRIENIHPRQNRPTKTPPYANRNGNAPRWARLTRTVFFQTVTRLRLLPLLFAASFSLHDTSAASARFHGFPSRQKLVVIAVPAPSAEPIAKLPPPVAPGTDKNLPIAHHSDVSGSVTIERNPPADTVSKPTEPKSDAELEAEARKARINAEHKRLDHNALLWQQERAAAGSATAQRSLAMRYLTGNGVEKDETKGMDLLRKAATGGDSAAIKELAKREPAKKE